MRNKKDTQETDSHISALELCLAGEGQPTYQDLGNNRIEVAEILEMPAHLEKQEIREFRFFALHFAWWFELLRQLLLSLSIDPSSVKINFLSSAKLVYSLILKSPSIEDAANKISQIAQLLSDALDDKMKSSIKLYSMDILDNIGDSKE